MAYIFEAVFFNISMLAQNSGMPKLLGFYPRPHPNPQHITPKILAHAHS
jgi:hypothetical protein